MVQRNIFYFISGIIITLASCKGTGDSDNTDLDSLVIDTTIGIDTLAINPIDTLQVDSAGYVNEEEALTTQIEKVYGKQWDFCDCVVKNDSVNKAIMETEDDDEFELISARMEVIDQHCKELLTTPNTTPDEREKHERKVKKCLRSAK
ncbi:hypothetical protein N8987_06305 [Crocinitomix sp.]|nr:hypothetical protein [Crocinitomix sp.]